MSQSKDWSSNARRAEFLRVPKGQDARQRRRLEHCKRGVAQHEARLQALRDKACKNAVPNLQESFQTYKVALAEIQKMWTTSPGTNGRLEGWQFVNRLITAAGEEASAKDGIEEMLLDAIMEIKPISVAVTDLILKQDTPIAMRTCVEACEAVCDLIGIAMEHNSRHLEAFMNLVPLLIVHLSGDIGNYGAECCAYSLGWLAHSDTNRLHRICLAGAPLPLTRALKVGASEAADASAVGLSQAAAYTIAELCCDESHEVRVSFSSEGFKQTLRQCLGILGTSNTDQQRFSSTLNIVNGISARRDSLLRLRDIDRQLLDLASRICGSIAAQLPASRLLLSQLRQLLQIFGNLGSKIQSVEPALAPTFASIWVQILKIVTSKAPDLLKEYAWALQQSLQASSTLRQSLLDLANSPVNDIRELMSQLQVDLDTTVDDSSPAYFMKSALKSIADQMHGNNSGGQEASADCPMT